MTRHRRNDGSPRKKRGAAAADEPGEPSPGAPVEPQLTVSYQRWCAAAQEDDLLFVECLLADVRRLLAAGGAFIVDGAGQDCVVVRDIRHLNDLAAQVRALHGSGADGRMCDVNPKMPT